MNMGFRISGKNMDIGEALRERIADRVRGALSKYYDGTVHGHVTVEREGAGFMTECVLHLSSGMTLQSMARALDAYQSADDAALHLEKRLRRYKRRLKDHHSTAKQIVAERLTNAASYVLEAPLDQADDEDVGEYHPVIIAEATTALKRLSVGEAVMELDLSGAPVVIFRHAGHGRVNFVYRRADGHIGWIDPSEADHKA